jgi:hypothetical protein
MGPQQNHNQEELESLENAFVSFAKALLNHMTSLVTSKGIPNTDNWHVDFIEEYWIARIQTKPDFWQVAQTPLDSLLKIDEINQCVKMHLEAGIPSYRYEFAEENEAVEFSKSEHIKFILTYDLISPILNALERYQTLQLSRQQIVETYRSFRDAWLIEDSHWDFTSPLLNFTSELQQNVAIGEQLQLSPFTTDEKEEIWNFGGSLLMLEIANVININDFSYSKFKLVSSYPHSQLQQHLDIQHSELLDWELQPSQGILMALRNFITALRLIKEGDVGAPVHFNRTRQKHSTRGMRPRYFVSSYEDQRVKKYSRIYELHEEELNLVRELHSSLMQMRNNNLIIALRLFNQSYSRNTWEDQIIDLTIALESTLLAGTEVELSSKLSLRGAALLARIRNPHETHTLLKRMYNIRSKIVHEGKQLSDFRREAPQPEHFVQTCENVVRDTLRTYITQLNDGQSIDDFNKRIDEHVIGSLQGN